MLGERIHAFVHTAGAAVDPQAVRVHGVQRLADDKVSETVRAAPAPLPRNANGNGKLLERTLREQQPG